MNVPTKKRGSKKLVGPPAMDLLLSEADRARIIASIKALPEPVRAKNVPRLVDLVEAALMENTTQLWATPPSDRGPEEALIRHLRTLFQGLEGLRPALDAMPPVPGDGYAYWSQPFARAVYGMFPLATRRQHADLVATLTSMAATSHLLQSAAHNSPGGNLPLNKIGSAAKRRAAPKKIDAAPEALEPVARLVRAVCYYLYESKYDLDFSWEPPEKGTSYKENDLAPSSHTATLLITVADAFGFDVEAGRLRTRLRDYGAVLRAGYREPDTRNYVELGEYRGKRLGEWRPPVLADLGGVIVQVMLADADAQAAASQSILNPASTN